MLDAVNSFRPLQTQLQPGGNVNVPSGSGGAAPAASAGDQGSYLPNLRRDPVKDYFVKSTPDVTPASWTPSVEKPSGVSGTDSVNRVNPKTDAASWVDSIKKLLPFQTQKVEKAQKTELPALHDAFKKLPSAGAAESPFAKATDQIAAKPQNQNPANLAKQNAPKKGGSDFSGALSAGGVSMLTLPVAGPAALVANPGIVSHVTAAAPAILP